MGFFKFKIGYIHIFFGHWKLVQDIFGWKFAYLIQWQHNDVVRPKFTWLTTAFKGKYYLLLLLVNPLWFKRIPENETNFWDSIQWILREKCFWAFKLEMVQTVIPRVLSFNEKISQHKLNIWTLLNLVPKQLCWSYI